MLNIVLFEPEIPPNTGNLIRLAANTGCSLHLIKPLGFDLDEKKVRRAGLDYRDMAAVTQHDNWQAYLNSGIDTSRIFALSTKGTKGYHQVDYREGDTLVFGPETRGLSQEFREALPSEHVLRIPMKPDSRSINLSNAVAIVSFEALRQLGFSYGD